MTEDEIALIVEQTRVQREQEVDEAFLQAPQVFADDGEAEDGEFDLDQDPPLARSRSSWPPRPPRSRSCSAASGLATRAP